MLLVEYAKKKKSINPQNILFEIYLFIYVIIIFLHKFWVLQILPPLTEISSSRFVRKGMQKVLVGA
jgi:hypothetical protein